MSRLLASTVVNVHTIAGYHLGREEGVLMCTVCSSRCLEVHRLPTLKAYSTYRMIYYLVEETLLDTQFYLARANTAYVCVQS